jgi:hypothetical protein
VECGPGPSGRFAHAAISFDPDRRPPLDNTASKSRHEGDKRKDSDKEKSIVKDKDKGKGKGKSGGKGNGKAVRSISEDEENVGMVLVHGGYDRKSSFNDLWTFDPRVYFWFSFLFF